MVVRHWRGLVRAGVGAGEPDGRPVAAQPTRPARDAVARRVQRQWWRASVARDRRQSTLHDRFAEPEGWHHLSFIHSAARTSAARGKPPAGRRRPHHAHALGVWRHCSAHRHTATVGRDADATRSPCCPTFRRDADAARRCRAARRYAPADRCHADAPRASCSPAFRRNAFTARRCRTTSGNTSTHRGDAHASRRCRTTDRQIAYSRRDALTTRRRRNTDRHAATFRRDALAARRCRTTDGNAATFRRDAFAARWCRTTDGNASTRRHYARGSCPPCCTAFRRDAGTAWRCLATIGHAFTLRVDAHPSRRC